MTKPPRASMFGGDDADLDVSAFSPKPRGAARPDATAVRKVAEQSGFPSREAPAASAPDRPRRGPPKTGRNMQLNLKVSREYLERFLALADHLGASQAETIERAIAALEQELRDE